MSIVPPHGLSMATGYDDNGTQTPARLLRSIRQLGYRGSMVHYVGMSHYFRLHPGSHAFLVGGPGDPCARPRGPGTWRSSRNANGAAFRRLLAVLRKPCAELPR